MSRWRPPQPKSAPYITPEGYQALEMELKALWDRRKEVTLALSAAAAEGDRSENAEYIYRKKELRGIDRRIHYLQRRLPSLNIVSETPADQDRIFFSAWVTLENEDGEEITYRIVGADELDPKKNYISLDSPLARALLKKTIDDEVVIKNALKESRYIVVDIGYKKPAGN
ncbi:transcription elongation factor GreB [Methylobacter luteus]|uniref:transcription elongation factor GreB n=1 Tax=Methylobacter luteus TaxID=415 RepID=UPI00041AD2C6|nr:transcription elongation factor GreB [Methylobacter luteus]